MSEAKKRKMSETKKNMDPVQVITKSFVVNDLTVDEAKALLEVLASSKIQNKLMNELTNFVGDHEIAPRNRVGELKSSAPFPPPYCVWLSKGPNVTYPDNKMPTYLIDKPVPMRGFGNGGFGQTTFETDLLELTHMVPQAIKISDIVVYTNSIHNLFRPPSYPHVMVHFLSHSQVPNVTLIDLCAK